MVPPYKGWFFGLVVALALLMLAPSAAFAGCGCGCEPYPKGGFCVEYGVPWSILRFYHPLPADTNIRQQLEEAVDFLRGRPHRPWAVDSDPQVAASRHYGKNVQVVVRGGRLVAVRVAFPAHRWAVKVKGAPLYYGEMGHGFWLECPLGRNDPRLRDLELRILRLNFHYGAGFHESPLPEGGRLFVDIYSSPVGEMRYSLAVTIRRVLKGKVASFLVDPEYSRAQNPAP